MQDNEINLAYIIEKANKLEKKNQILNYISEKEKPKSCTRCGNNKMPTILTVQQRKQNVENVVYLNILQNIAKHKKNDYKI